MLKRIVLTVMTVFVTNGLLSAQDTVYPAGSSVMLSYDINDSVITFGDTLAIRRQLIHDGAFNLNGLYFSDNIPSEFQLASQSVRLNGSTILFLSVGPIGNQIVSNYDLYRWIIDSPDSLETMNQAINPGDTVELEVTFITTDIGEFVLPLHTTAFVTGGTGYFTIGDSIEIRVTLALDAGEDDDASPLLPAGHIVSNAYPNPFNPQLTIDYSWQTTPDRSLRFEVFDILGRRVYNHNIKKAESTGTVHWTPEADIGSGVYFYRLSSSVAASSGKVTLLK